MLVPGVCAVAGAAGHAPLAVAAVCLLAGHVEADVVVAVGGDLVMADLVVEGRLLGGRVLGGLLALARTALHDPGPAQVSRC